MKANSRYPQVEALRLVSDKVEKKRFVINWKVVSALLVVVTVSLSFAVYRIHADSVGPSCPVNPFDYTIYYMGSTYYACNGRIGNIDFTATSAQTILNNTVAALASSGGMVLVTDSVTMPKSFTPANNVSVLVEDHKGNFYFWGSSGSTSFKRLTGQTTQLPSIMVFRNMNMGLYRFSCFIHILTYVSGGIACYIVFGGGDGNFLFPLSNQRGTITTNATDLGDFYSTIPVYMGYNGESATFKTSGPFNATYNIIVTAEQVLNGS